MSTDLLQDSQPEESSGFEDSLSESDSESEFPARMLDFSTMEIPTKSKSNLSSSTVNAPKTQDSKKRKLFQRVFSEAHEILLLKGMADFIKLRKADPAGNIDEFIDFLMESKLDFDVTKEQLVNKMRKLKLKFLNNARKGKDGRDRKFSKKHEREAFEVSKRIWGVLGVEERNVDAGFRNGKMNGNVVKKSGSKNVGDKANAVTRFDDDDDDDDDKMLEGVTVASRGVAGGVGGSPVYSALEQRVMSEKLGNIDIVKQRGLERRWSEIEVAELELYAKRCEYMAEKAMLIADAKRAEL